MEKRDVQKWIITILVFALFIGAAGLLVTQLIAMKKVPMESVEVAETNEADEADKATAAMEQELLILENSKEYAVGKVFSLELTGDTLEKLEAGESITLEFKDPLVKEGDSVIVAQYGDDGWQEVPAVAGDGVLTVTFTSPGEVAFLYEVKK